YWTDILPSTIGLYAPYDNFGFLTDALFILIPLFAIITATGDYRGRGALAGARLMLVAAALGALALFIIQRKGWPHQALPVVMFLGALGVFNLVPEKNRTRLAFMLNSAVATTALIG